MTTRFWGPFSPLGTIIMALIFVADQLTKYWILTIVNLDERDSIAVTPFLNLTMAWNKGVSYGLLTTHAQQILILMSIFISLVLFIWLARAASNIAAVGLGFIIGGALGNVVDRYLHGAVADFVHFHWGSFNWYIFNVADIAIVAGVLLMVYDGFFEKRSV
ncbi:MAG: signal peptidase II [Proteobacteria bacterium]|nr:signal peptidase II [Pseudomonadota bacterium]